jgi:acetyl-CoA carboxylase biotin carboxyl carrier protein
MDISLIKKLIKLLQDNHLNELTVEEGDLKISLKQGGQVVSAMPVSAAPVSAAAPQATPAAPAISGNTIKAPMIGTFYRSAGPDKEPFVKVGQTIKKGDVLCIIEAMKLFNEIQSEVSGTVTKVLVDNGQAVEYDQPLFIVE